jgi:DNA-binding HxlR family transcriptional regulator
VRAGAYALTLLSVPLNVHVLTALELDPLPLMELRRAAGSPPQTTMRKHLHALTQLGVIERRREAGFPGSVDYDLNRPGRELLGVAQVLQSWLAEAPDGPLLPGDTAAKSAIKALTEGWSSLIVRALAARPLALTELTRLIPALNYPSLERRLGAMRLAGQITPSPSEGRSRPYMATEWLRKAIGPLVAGAEWERRHRPPASTPAARIDVESAFLLPAPLLCLSPNLSGTAKLAVESRRTDGSFDRAGVWVEVAAGEVVSCVADLKVDAGAWATGSLEAWLSMVIEGDPRRLEIGGDRDLALTFAESLHSTLFSAPAHA